MGVCPEQWILDNPQAIIDVQSQYRRAGSDIVYAPTFGGNRCKLEEFGLDSRLAEINTRLVELSRKAAGDGYVFGDLAPTGRFVEPFGDMGFEEAVDVFREQAQVLVAAGVDGFVIETMIDIQEARAALLAVREVCDLPVMVSMTFEKEGRTLTGSDPLTALVTLQSLGADAVGCNCSTGPESMIEVIRSIKPLARIPLLAKPNAGLPRLRDGKTVFDMGAGEFASHVDAFLEAGVNILGGCCGTTPEHIAAMASRAAGRAGEPARVRDVSAVSSARRTMVFSGERPLAVVGERINPTGKKDLQAELREGRLDLVLQFAREQAEQGADVLDVNMGFLVLMQPI